MAAAVHGAMEEASRQIRSVNGHGKLKLVHLILVRKIEKNNKNHRALNLTDQSQVHNTTKEIEK